MINNEEEQQINDSMITIEEETPQTPAVQQEQTPAEGGGQSPAPAAGNETGDEPPQQSQQQPAEQQPQQQQEQEQGQEEKTITETIKEQFGIQELSDKEFPDTTEGVVQLASEAARQLAVNEFQRMTSQDPLVKEVIEHQQNGGDPRKLLYTKYPQSDYRNIELDREDTDQHKQIVRDYYKRLGESDEDIQTYIKDLEQAGTLSERAERFLTKLTEAQTKDERELKEQQRKQQEEYQRKVQEFWSGVWNTLNKMDNIGGIKLPESEKSGFFSYIADKVSEDGMSKADLDRSNRDTNQQLLHDYIDYLQNEKGYTLQSLIKNTATSAATRSLTEQIKSNNDANGKGKTPQTGKPGSGDDIDFNQTVGKEEQ